MKKTRIMTFIILIFINTIFFTSCASLNGGPKRVVDIDIEIEALQTLFNFEKVKEYFNEPLNSNNRKSIRDKIVTAKLYAIDLQFTVYAQGLGRELRSSPFGLDLASLLLTGTATVLTQGTATRILSGVDTALKGGQQSFSKNILIDKTLDVLLTQMMANRKKIATQIWTSLLKHDDSKYPLPLALSQLEDYYQAGTIAGAFMSISKSASDNAEEATKKFENEVIKVPYGENNNTKLLNDYVDSVTGSSEELKRLKKIEALIKVFNDTGDTIEVTELIDTNKSEWLLLQKKIVNALELGGS